jgi:hypothetical protein
MARNDPISVKDAVYKMQLSLLDGIKDERQLFAAGSLMSQSDYQDIVAERSIAKVCGYPLCRIFLPSERPHKGKYRIELKEHKVYDLTETYKYCSTSCMVNSQAFSKTLKEERRSYLDPEKLGQIMNLFEGLDLNLTEDLGKNDDLGLSKLTIQENLEVKSGDVSLKEWIGPSNAIEGYVPKKDWSIKRAPPKNRKPGPKPDSAKPNTGKQMIFNDMDFMSSIITQDDEYTISKVPQSKEALKIESSPVKSRFKVKFEDSDIIPKISNLSISDKSSNADALKSSLKSSGGRKSDHSVTWADGNNKSEKGNGNNLCEFSEVQHKIEASDGNNPSTSKDMEEDHKSSRFASAEACAVALSQAAEFVASGESDALHAVSQAGITILPPPQYMNEDENVGMLDPEPNPIRWSKKQGISHSDFFDSEDSWFDSPPDGFNLNLSPFASMFMALFSWISSSSLAYIYGQDESLHEQFLSVNGREYLRKIVLSDGRSAEIKKALAGCLARSLAGLVEDLRLPTPISALEKGLGRLLNTLSFSDALPALRMKQWQVIVYLFLEALSVSQFPAFAAHVTSSRTLFNKVLEAAEISAEEYDIMKDIVMPLGRSPQLSTHSGG